MAPRKPKYKCWTPNNIKFNVPIPPPIVISDYTILKDATPLTYTTVGDTINYTVTVTNIGQTDLSDIPLNDPFLGYTDIITSLPIGSSQTLNIGTHIVTQADIDNGSITNTITSNTKSSSITVTVVQSLVLTIDKLAAPQAFSAVGQVIVYTYNINNNSNVTLTDLVLTDDKIGTIDTFTLAPGATTSLTANYTITQTDMDNGSVTNTAEVANNLISATDTVIISVQVPFALTITKTADVTTYSAVGDIINYTIVVNNIGSSDMPAVNIIDALVGLNTTVPILSGQSHSEISPYTVTQADLDNGSITNTASASGEGVTVDTTQVINANQQPAVTLVKTATPAAYDSLGQIINYSYVMTNTGNVTLNNLALTDDKLGALGTYNILPGQNTTRLQNYTITQADIDTGFITNEATVSNILASATSNLTINYVNIDFTVTKTALPTTYNTVGQVITYSFLITNTGTDNIINPRIIDTRLNLDTIIDETIIPGGSYTFTDTYTITQADIDIGFITNVATVEYLVSRSATTTITAVQNPSLSITKNSDLSSFIEVGQTVGYQYNLVNNGNTTINNIAVNDDKIPVPIASNFTLAPGESIILNSYWITTATDVANGSITNTVTAASGSTTANASVTIPFNQISFTLTKIANTSTYATVGQVITYTFRVINTGSLPIPGPVTITDPLIPTITPNNFINIPVGTSVIGTGTYTITFNDVIRRSVDNTATATDTSSGINTQTLSTITYSNPLLFINIPSITIPAGVTTASYVIVGGGGAGGTATPPSTSVVGGGGGGRSPPNIGTITLVPGVTTMTTVTGTGGNTNINSGQGGSGTASTLTYNGVTRTAIGGAGGYTFSEPNGGSVGGGGASPNGLGNPNGSDATISRGGNGGTGSGNPGNLPFIFTPAPGIGGAGGANVSTSRGLGGGGAGGLGNIYGIKGGGTSTTSGGQGGQGYGAGGGGGYSNANAGPRQGGPGAPGIVTVQFS